MKKAITCAVLILLMARTSYGQINYQLPIEIGISEDGINLFLLKQYDDLSENIKIVTFNYQGLTYKAELLPLSVDLKSNIVDTYLNYQVRVSWNNTSAEVDFSFYVSFDLGGTDELNVNFIIESVRNGIQNNNLPSPVKTFILESFDDLNLQAYPESIVERLNQDPVIEQNPIVFTSFSDAFEINNDVLDIAVTFNVQAEEPKTELMITNDGYIRFRLNFKASFGEFLLDRNLSKMSTSGNCIAYVSECTYVINPPINGQDFNKHCTVYITNDNKAHRAYFNLLGVLPGVWIPSSEFH